MGARAEAVASTRAEIVSAAMKLHTERGVVATSWDDVAREAGVSTATVYRHFPSLAELVPGCARTVFDLIQPPTLEQASRQFAALRTAAARFEHLVRASSHCYTRGEGWLHAAHRERDFVPELDRALRIMEDSLWVLVRAAAGGPLSRHVQQVLFVLCDFPLWKSLVDAGLSRRSAEDVIVRLVAAEVARAGLDPEEGP
jgi:AcrR family transcriptional regulator